MESFQGKRKSAMSVSLFRTLSESFAPERPSATNAKPPKDFRGGVVGLGIVAAMNGGGVSYSVSSRSSPIPIVSSIRAVADFRGGLYLDGDADSDGGGEVDESSESYTCVISRGGDDSVTKRVYFDGKLSKIDGNERPVVSGVFSASPDFIDGAEGEFWTSDFLSTCFLCKKQLDGLDIFMYRGEKAFCSWDCRDKHIISDGCKEKCNSEAMKSRDYAPSLCTSPRVILAGVAAA